MCYITVCLFVVILCLVLCSHGGKVNHYLVAMDFNTKRLTINGEQFFDHLPELVEVRRHFVTVSLSNCQLELAFLLLQDLSTDVVRYPFCFVLVILSCVGLHLLLFHVNQ